MAGKRKKSSKASEGPARSNRPFLVAPRYPPATPDLQGLPVVPRTAIYDHLIALGELDEVIFEHTGRNGLRCLVTHPLGLVCRQFRNELAKRSTEYAINDAPFVVIIIKNFSIAPIKAFFRAVDAKASKTGAAGVVEFARGAQGGRELSIGFDVSRTWVGNADHMLALFEYLDREVHPSVPIKYDLRNIEDIAGFSRFLTVASMQQGIHQDFGRVLESFQNWIPVDEPAIEGSSAQERDEQMLLAYAIQGGYWAGEDIFDEELPMLTEAYRSFYGK